MNLGESEDLYRFPTVQDGKRWTLTSQLNCRQKLIARTHMSIR